METICKNVQPDTLFTIFPPKVKSILEQATKSQKGSRNTALLFFNLDARRGVDGQRHAPTVLPLG